MVVKSKQTTPLVC